MLPFPVTQPPAASSNHYGEHGEFQLPNSGFRVSYSTHYHRLGAETDSAVVPDRQIEPTWGEFRAGLDPVLDPVLAWILSQRIGLNALDCAPDRE